MWNRYQINLLYSALAEFIKHRPLLIPAIIGILIVNIYAALKPDDVSVSDIMTYGTVRHVDYNLDGTVDIQIRTEDYGRLLYKADSDEGYKAGDFIYISGDIIMPDAPSNPGEFDYPRYLKRRGISGLLYPDTMYVVRPSRFPSRVGAFVNVLSFKLRCFSLSVFDEEDKGLAAALFMGDSSLVDDKVSRAFRLSNCSHLLAVSGTHFSGFLMMLSAYISGTHLNRKYSVPLYIVFCILTGTFTGWSESVTRAAVMSVCGFLARDFLSGMSLASIMIMTADPYSCLSTGFMMSFMASLSIKLFAPRLKEIAQKKDFPSVLSDLLIPAVSATVGMIPFWGRNCYYFSCLHLLIQILSSLLATAACVFFLPSVITGLPFTCSIILRIISGLMDFCSRSSVEGASSRGLTPLFIYSLFILVCIWLMPDGFVRRHVLLPSFLFTLYASILMLSSVFNAPDATVVFIDVGQGDSCLIFNSRGSIIIDGGVETEGKYSVSPVLDYYGIDQVDVAVASHMDEDHIGGLNYLMDAGRIERLYTCYDLRSGDVLEMEGGMKFYCVWPYEVFDGGNEDSVVLRFEYGDFSILFTGDIGFESEEALIYSGADIDADILKVGHHGSAYSTSSAFLERVSPETAVISVVRNSPYGHPASQTLQRLYDYGCEVRRTDLEGAIIYELSVSE